MVMLVQRASAAESEAKNRPSNGPRRALSNAWISRVRTLGCRIFGCGLRSVGLRVRALRCRIFGCGLRSVGLRVRTSECRASGTDFGCRTSGTGFGCVHFSTDCIVIHFFHAEYSATFRLALTDGGMFVPR